MNVYQDGENYHVRSEIPGVKLEDLEVSVTGRNLTVSKERKFEVEDPRVSYHRTERHSGSSLISLLISKRRNLKLHLAMVF